MLVALERLGNYLRRKDETGLDYYLTLDRLSNSKRILCIDFEWNGQDAHYRGVHLEAYNNEKGKKVLYSRGTSGGGDYSPTSIIVIDKPKKTLQRIWDYGWFGKFSGKSILVEELRNAYNRREVEIEKDVESEYKELSRKEKRGCLLTIKIWIDETEQFIHSFDVFKESVRNNVTKSWTEKHDVVSKGQGICSLCKRESDVVGFGFPFPFMSFDKKGFAPQLLQELSWKQLPLCEDCAYSLRAAKSFLEENALTYTVGEGIRYYIIPEFPLTPPPESLMKRILKGKDHHSEYLISAEDYYTPLILETKLPPMNMIFLFFSRPQQSQQLIEKYIENISPSWIKKLYKATDRIKNKSIFQEQQLKKILGEKSKGDWRFDSLDKILRSILPPWKVHNYKELALEYTKNILKSEKISWDRLLSMFVEELQRRFINELKSKSIKFNDSTRVYSLNTFIFTCFLLEINILDTGEDMMVSSRSVHTNSKNDVYNSFFQEYSEAFDAPEKKAVFLEGVLTRFLMNVQYATRRSTPFQSKLHGLRLNVDRVKALLSEIEDKLEAYDLGYRDLRKALSRYMLEAEQNGWKTTNDEVTYFFTLGLNLSGLFK